MIKPKKNTPKREPRKGRRSQGRRARQPEGPPKELAELPGEPVVLPRDEHPISRKDVDEDALKVLYRLNRHGYHGFLVGGAVRDLYIGKAPKDFDIGTDALPEEIRPVFRNSRIIGKRFKLNHIYFKGGKILELATFRSNTEEQSPGETMLAPDNTYGDPESDAYRRDLTINGLFYNIADHSIVDYVGGISDLEQGIVRFIGDARVRVQEDPVRMIRAIRHASRTGFSIEAASYDAICEFPSLLKLCPQARVYEELLKDLKSGASRTTFPMLRDAGLLKFFLPSLSHFAERSPQVWQRMLETFSLLDKHIQKSGKEVATAPVMAALLVGNVPVAEIKQCLGESREALILRTLLSEKPFSENSEERAELESGETFKVHSEIIGRLRKVLAELLRPLGVSRKDCEEIEKLLVIRSKLFQVHATNQKRTKIPHAKSLPAAVLLMKLSRHSEWAEEGYGRWKNARPAGR